MRFETINDVAAEVERCVGFEVEMDDVRSAFHASGIEYGDWIERDDERFGAMVDGLIATEVAR